MDFTTGGRLEVRITPDDVGKRVSVRLVTEDREPGATFTDVVGVLTSWTEGTLSITRRTGEPVRIAESSLVAGKVVPAAPARRRGPAASAPELDRVAARAWPPVTSEPLGEWTLRASGGFTRRANSVLPLGDPGMGLDAALRRVTAWYAARELPAYIQVSTGAEGTQELLAAELESRGWIREVSSLMEIAALAPIGDLDADISAVTLSRHLDDAWLTRYQRSSGEPSPEARAVLSGGPSVWFATIAAEGGGAPAAIGRCVVDGRWAGFTAVEVAPERRRQGLAKAVMTALARTALDEGASAAYLQVETDNDGAHALYEGMGFTVHHSYHHWRASGQDPR
ncbi:MULTISPECIES: GNAT family N-acetyltransferase [unclassified Streptomyces]|uniref:GNAT family N-acetyltransferase n=1 Tax=unclassified Streptomyces TaxID=2593676 RepID=UPI00168B860E|nr:MULTISPECIES: GNAT family N-acetyltransferase [unclassified Streptomyces]MBD3007798.1 GNAT family N-acetyltransferase [Streptomyces sp. 5-10]